jgi:hypothetical protein
MLNFAEQTGSGAVIVVWSLLPMNVLAEYTYGRTWSWHTCTLVDSCMCLKLSSNFRISPTSTAQQKADHRSQGAWLYFRLCIDLIEWSPVGFSQQTPSVVSWWWQIFIFPSSSTTTSKQLA